MLTEQEEIQAYREVLEESLQKICETLGIDPEMYDRDQSDFACYSDFFDDVNGALKLHRIKYDDDEGEFVQQPNAKGDVDG